MKKLTAMITFACFLAVSTAEGRVLSVFIKTGCSMVLVPATRACGSCSPFGSRCETYKCVPFSKVIVSLKNMIDYKQANSIASRNSNELSNPALNAILGDPHGQSIERPAGKTSDTAAGHSEETPYIPVFENLAFIHPQISITVLRL